MHIDNIIFDFGGVILDINPKLTMIALKELGFENWEKLDSPEFYQEVIFPFEKGLDTPAIFRNKMRDYLKMNLTDEEIDTAWNALLFKLQEDRIRLLESVKRHYNIFLLSNSNIIHYHEFLNDLSSNFGYNEFDALFHKAYFSFELQLIKPDKKIYEHVILDQKLDPVRTLFIDDRLENTEGARSTGLKARHLINGDLLTDLFDENGLLKENY